MEFEIPNDSILYADSSRGVYIPQHFAETIDRDCVMGVSDWDWEELSAGPNNAEFYWDAWDAVLCNAIVTDPKTGIAYDLWQDGDLWLVPRR